MWNTFFIIISAVLTRLSDLICFICCIKYCSALITQVYFFPFFAELSWINPSFAHIVGNSIASTCSTEVQVCSLSCLSSINTNYTHLKYYSFVIREAFYALKASKRYLSQTLTTYPPPPLFCIPCHSFCARHVLLKHPMTFPLSNWS